MIYWEIFLAFFIPNLLGYGGGPAVIPLIEHEVVDHYHWLTTQEFQEILALGNVLPGPIATKLAAYVGYKIAGIPGVLIALFATVGPSLILMITLLFLLYQYRHSPIVKRMTNYIRPIVAILLFMMTYEFIAKSYENIGLLHTFLLTVASLVLMEILKIHPAWVIAGSLGYGYFFLT